MPYTSFIQNSIPVLLSSIFPGLGQWYKKEILKGTVFFLAALFLVGVFLSHVDMETLQRLRDSGVPPTNFGTILMSTVMLMGVLLWSMYDASRSTRKIGQTNIHRGNKNKE